MAGNSVTKVSRQSWFSRLGNAIKGIVVGFVLFVLAFPLLWWNEGRAVTTYKSLREGAAAVVSVSAEQADPANEGRLVHMTGKAVTDDILADAQFGVSVNAIKLQRTVEMYQWRERKSSSTQKRVGGSTETTETFTYEKTWSSSPIDSSPFQDAAGHRNPGSFPYQSVTRVADNVTVGAFKLNSSLIGSIGNFRPLEVTAKDGLPPDLAEKTMVHEGGYYIGANPADPQIGDMRVTFAQCPPTEVSLIARQIGNTFEPYQTEAGRALQMLNTGVHSADSMFEQAQAANVRTTWLLRAAGFVLMWVGLGLVFGLLSVLADVLRILGNIVGAGVKLITLLVAGMLSFLTIALAWIYYRPVLGIGLLVVAIALATVVIKKLKQAKAPATAPAPEAAAG